MAIITSSELKEAHGLAIPDLPYNCEVDLDTKTVIKLPNFPVVMVGDNNSVVISIKTPLEYKGVDLSGTNCVLSYEVKNSSKLENKSNGQIDLTNTCKVNTEIEDGVEEKYLLFNWILDINQTAFSGICSFNLAFLMNLEEDPYMNMAKVEVKLDSNANESYFESGIIEETSLRYWSVSIQPATFTINENSVSLNSDYNFILPENLEETLEDINNQFTEIDLAIDETNKSIEVLEKDIKILNLKNVDINEELNEIQQQITNNKNSITNLSMQTYQKTRGKDSMTQTGITWYYETMSDGTSSCWGVYTMAFSELAKWPNISDDLYYIYVNRLKYPSGLFYEGSEPVVLCSILSTSSAAFWLSGEPIDVDGALVSDGPHLSTPYYSLIRPTQINGTQTVKLSFLIKGRWEE